MVLSLIIAIVVIGIAAIIAGSLIKGLVWFPIIGAVLIIGSGVAGWARRRLRS